MVIKRFLYWFMETPWRNDEFGQDEGTLGVKWRRFDLYILYRTKDGLHVGLVWISNYRCRVDNLSGNATLHCSTSLRKYMFKRIFRSTAAWPATKGKQQVNYTVDLSNAYNFSFIITYRSLQNISMKSGWVL